MVKLIYRLFKKQFTALVHADRTRLTKDKLVYWFSDEEGRNYYKFPNDMAKPLERLAQLKMFYSWLSAGLSGEELDACLDVIEEAAHEGMKNPQAAAKVTAMTSVMRERRTYSFNIELYYNIIAVLAVREDENIETINNTIQMEKVEAFKRMTANGGSYFFFQEKLSETPINLSAISPNEWNTLVAESSVLEMQLRQINDFLKQAKESQTTATSSTV